MNVKQNYQLQLDACINNLDYRPRVALHSCCAPCSSYVIEYLSKHFDVTVVFYNPNIHPEQEYLHRLSEQKRLCDILGVPCVELDYLPSEFFDAVKGLENEKEGGARCQKCFEMRLSRTARYAVKNGFDYFCSTLTVSPHKNADVINSVGSDLERLFGIPWLVNDFKKRSGYLRSIELSKEYELYRQDYCGCIYSKGDEKIS